MIPASTRTWRSAPPHGRAPGHPAVRLLAVVLLVVTSMVVAPRWLPVPALLVLNGLHLAGLRWRRLPALLVPWSLPALVVLAAHTVSATDAAPLWQPSLVGLGRGLIILARLALVLGAVALADRLMSVRDLTTAVAWLLRPLRPLGVDTRHLGLTVAVALGTAPRTRVESERLVACLRLRRPAAARRPWHRFSDRVRVVPPLMDGIMRRAETLPLALAHRVPAEASPAGAVPWYQFLPLAIWAVSLWWLR